MFNKCKILILAVSPETQGGITSVIKAYQQCDIWKKYHCRWIATQTDKNIIYKLLIFIKSWLCFIMLLPFYDIVHIHTSEPPSAFRKCFYLPIAKLWRKRVLVHFHSFSVDTTIKSKWSVFYKFLFHQADVVIALSPYWEREINNTFHLGSKVRILYNPCTCEKFDKSYAKKNNILYAGVLNARKGYADLLKAFAIIADKLSHWSLVFAGSGEIENAKSLAKDLGIEKQVKFLGWVNGIEKDKAFKEASVFCLPSYAEGFPMAVLDAWAYGLPVITTPVGGIVDIAQNESNVLLFETGNINELSFCLKKIIEDNTLRTYMHEEALSLSNKFDKEIIANQLAVLYNELNNNIF